LFFGLSDGVWDAGVDVLPSPVLDGGRIELLMRIGGFAHPDTVEEYLQAAVETRIVARGRRTPAASRRPSAITALQA